MRNKKLVEEILVSLDYQIDNSSQQCFIVFSSRESHIEIVIDAIQLVLGDKFNFNIIRLDEALKSGDSQYGELTSYLNSSSFSIVILDGFRPNVLFEYGIIKGLGKPSLVLLEQDARIDINSLFDEPIDLKNPPIQMDKHFSDVKDRFYVTYDKNNPRDLRSKIKTEYDKLKTDIDEELVRMIFPNKDIIEKDIRNNLITLTKLLDKSYGVFDDNDIQSFKSIISENNSYESDKRINFPILYYYIVSQIYERIGKNKKAMNIIDSLIVKEPANIQFYIYKSYLFRKLNQPSEAMDIIDSAIDINPNVEALWHNKGLLYESMNKSNKALDSYKKALEIDPGCKELYFHYGVLLYEKKEVKKSLQVFEKALKLGYKDSELFVWKVKCLYRLRKNNDANICIKHALKLHEKNANLWFILGLHTNDGNELIYYNNAIKNDPNHYGAKCSKAAYLSNNGKHQEALDIFWNIYSKCPESNKCTTLPSNIIKTIISKKGKLTKKQFNHFIDLKGSSALVYEIKALAYFVKKDYKQAIEFYNKSLKKSSKNYTIWLNKACMHSLIGEIPEVINALKVAIELKPSKKTEMISDSDFDRIRHNKDFKKNFF
jgi:tetratricopeptide (TPR) repeat protein